MAKTASSCYICGSSIAGSVNRDHVVPDCMFAKPLPNDINLLTFPTHRKCHDRLDEEYVRNVLVAFCHDRNRTAKALWDSKIKRSFVRNERLRRQTRESLVRRIETISPAGLYLRTDPGFRLDKERFYKTPKKIFRGLYTWYCGDVLLSDLCLPVYMAEPERSCHPEI